MTLKKNFLVYILFFISISYSFSYTTEQKGFRLYAGGKEYFYSYRCYFEQRDDSVLDKELENALGYIQPLLKQIEAPIIKFSFNDLKDDLSISDLFDSEKESKYLIDCSKSSKLYTNLKKGNKAIEFFQSESKDACIIVYNIENGNVFATPFFFTYSEGNDKDSYKIDGWCRTYIYDHSLGVIYLHKILTYNEKEYNFNQPEIEREFEFQRKYKFLENEIKENPYTSNSNEEKVEAKEISKIKMNGIEVPVQEKDTGRKDCNTRVTFISFNSDSGEEDIQSFLDDNNIDYDKYNVFPYSGGEIISTRFLVEDFSYKGAKINYVQFDIAERQFSSIRYCLDTVRCVFLTRKDYNIFLQHIKETYNYSEKESLFYGQSRRYPVIRNKEQYDDYSGYIYYDEITCNPLKLEVTYNFTCSYKCPIILSESIFNEYEPFEREWEIPRDVYVVTFDNKTTLKFCGTHLERVDNNIVLFLDFRTNTIAQTKVKLSAYDAYKTLIYEKRPFGKRISN